MTALTPTTAATLADALLVLHSGIVVFVVLGTVLILIGGWRRWCWVHGFAWRLVHLLLMGFIVVQTWLGDLCPLTVWEQTLRRRAGQVVYEESFIEHWLSQLIFFDAPWWMFIAAYTAFAVLVMVLWSKVPPQRCDPHIDPSGGSRTGGMSFASHKRRAAPGVCARRMAQETALRSRAMPACPAISPVPSACGARAATRRFGQGSSIGTRRW